MIVLAMYTLNFFHPGRLLTTGSKLVGDALMSDKYETIRIRELGGERPSDDSTNKLYGSSTAAV